MSNFRTTILPVMPFISTLSPESLGLLSRQIGLTGATTSVAWPSANRAYFVPFKIRETLSITKLFTINGSTASNNFDIGIYDEFGTKIVSSGSTAQSGTSTLQAVDITDTTIGPGLFYWGLAFNGAVGTIAAFSGIASPTVNIFGIYSQNTAFALPASATFASSASAFAPIVGMTVAPITITS